jgi:hypothetical protein
VATAPALWRAKFLGSASSFGILWDDELRQSKVYRNSVELAEAASKAEQSPPVWGN